MRTGTEIPGGGEWEQGPKSQEEGGEWEQGPRSLEGGWEQGPRSQEVGNGNGERDPRREVGGMGTMLNANRSPPE